MSILVGNCSTNIDNYILTCRDKKMVIKEIMDALTKIGIRPIQVDLVDVDTSENEILWIRDIFVPIDNVYLKCNLTKKSTMNTDRRNEFDSIQSYLDNSKKIIQIPQHISFEGGDLIQYKNYIFIGIGKRTGAGIVDKLKKYFPNKHIIAVNHSALHLDCCMCVLDNDMVFYDSKYIENIRIPALFRVYDISNIVDSGKYMATNFIQFGNILIMSDIKKNAAFRKMLRSLGYKIILVNTRQIWKEGGDIRCLTQWL